MSRAAGGGHLQGAGQTALSLEHRVRVQQTTGEEDELTENERWVGTHRKVRHVEPLNDV